MVQEGSQRLLTFKQVLASAHGLGPGCLFALLVPHLLPLNPPGLALLEEGDPMNAQLLVDLSHALEARRAHPMSHISLDGLAVRTH
jgi:hypothetical protein